jgi:hypothetical protein
MRKKLVRQTECRRVVLEVLNVVICTQSITRFTFMSNEFTRRDLLKSSGVILGTGILAPHLVFADLSRTSHQCYR